MTTKSILLIAPDFFNYHETIRRELVAQGHTVYFVPDRPSKKAIVKILIRKCRFLLGPYLRRHYRRTFSDIPPEIDEVFIIKGEAITPDIAAQMRRRFRRARFQIYLWDSLINSPGALSLIRLMDRVFTFDLDDSKAHRDWHFLPNFFTSQNLVPVDPPQWNLTFIGTIHSDRLKVLAKLSQAMPRGFTFYRFLFFQSPVLYYARKLFDPCFKLFSAKEMSFKPILGEELRQITSSTVAMLDIHHPKQSGCSHRVIECLAMGMKLVTTNARIREYPFYDERLVCIIDRENPTLKPDFFRTRPNFAAPAELSNLEISHWLGAIFSS